MPPRPYLPTGILRAAICYPSTHIEYIESALAEALEWVDTVFKVKHFSNNRVDTAVEF